MVRVYQYAVKDVFMVHVFILINVFVTLVGLAIIALLLVSVMDKVVVSMKLDSIIVKTVSMALR